MLASQAIALVAHDPYGLDSILEEAVVPTILKAIEDSSIEVRESIYECISDLSRTTAGAMACVEAGASEILPQLLNQEQDVIKPLLLKSIHNMSSLAKGLEDALKHHTVKLCIEYLNSSLDTLHIEAAKTLGFLCFSDRGKELAVEGGAVHQLMGLISRMRENEGVLSSASLALMAITSTDEGKRQMTTVINAVDVIVYLIKSPLKVICLNGLKIISNIAVHPALRNQLRKHEDCLPVLQSLLQSDSFTQKHAKIAYDAVMWKP